MTTRAPIAATAATTSPEGQAASLWTFVHLRVPGLSSADTLELVRELAPSASEPIKSLATRLQRLLASRGVAIKRTHALDAVARLLGHQSWVGVPKKSSPAPLHLVSAFRDLNRPLYSWKEAIECFCDWCEGDVIGGGMHVYQIGFGKSSVTFDSPFTSSTDCDGKVAHQLEIRWHTESTGQLAAAISGIETMRRRYEETGKGIVDGLAAAQYCLRTPHSDAQPDDPINSELVVIEVTPGPSYGDEVARGDEVKCWSELEKVHPKESCPTYSLDEGRWVVGKCMYEWQLSTVRVQGPVSSVLTRSLTTAESGTLFRRHQQAVRSGLYFCREDKVKRLHSVDIHSQLIEVDWEVVRSKLFEQFGSGSSEVANEFARRGPVAVTELLNLAERLEVADPSIFVRKPKRRELVLLRDDQVLRAFISRVHDVRCEVPRRLTDETVKAVDDAVNLMLTALKNDVVMADGQIHAAFPRNDPYMVYANQGKDTLKRLKQLGLVAYAGIITTVAPFRARSGWERNVKSTSPFKVETVLFLDIDFEEQG
jgi:hypothetical protein